MQRATLIEPRIFEHRVLAPPGSLHSLDDMRRAQPGVRAWRPITASSMPLLCIGALGSLLLGISCIGMDDFFDDLPPSSTTSTVEPSCIVQCIYPCDASTQNMCAEVTVAGGCIACTEEPFTLVECTDFVSACDPSQYTTTTTGADATGLDDTT